MIGGVKDIQECIGAAGYTWEGRLGKCVRPWLEKAVVVNILSQMTPCVANSQTLCLQIQRRNGIEVFSGTIAGWSYTPGYAYRLLLQSQIDENAGSAMTPSYTLIKVLSMRGQNPIGLVGTDWSIASLNGNVITSPGTISFTRSTISGRLCNNFSGIYSANWNTITAPTMISTEMYCTTDAMSVEDALHLNGATYVLSENTLTLRTLAGDTIVWKKKVY